MRLRKTSTRLLAASLCLAVAVSCTGCGGSGGGPVGGENAPSSAPSGSVGAPEPTQPDAPGESGDKKDDGADVPVLNSYEPIDTNKTVRSFSDDFEFYIVLDYSAENGENGRYVKFRGPYSHFTKGSSINPNLCPTLVDCIPEDYLKDSQNLVSNYVWDCYGKKIVHIKNSKGSSPIASSNWEYRDGYKYLCEITGGNQIIEVRESLYKDNHDWPIENFDGWCKNEDVDKIINQLNAWPDKVIALDGCPFQENLKTNPHSNTSGYYLYNGRVYFEYNN